MTKEIKEYVEYRIKKEYDVNGVIVVYKNTMADANYVYDLFGCRDVVSFKRGYHLHSVERKYIAGDGDFVVVNLFKKS